MLSVGIIGLPNVGKSTLFNALTSGSAHVSNYPFTTIDSNVGVVPIPDPRLVQLQRVLSPKETIPALIEFIDIAGLVRGASRGEGLGNQFLGNIRGVDAIIHVVRCFHEAEVSHVLGDVDPGRDIDVVETELLLADLELMDRLIEKRFRTWNTSPRQYAAEEKRFRHYRASLAAGVALRKLELDEDSRRELKALGLLSGKPVLLAANVSEDDYPLETVPSVQRISQSRLSESPVVVRVCARLEYELQQLTPQDRNEFMTALGIKTSGVDQLIREAHRVLNLLTFFTNANDKLQAWSIVSGTKAPQAAGKVHTDMERGFIRAQVAGFEQVLQHTSLQALHKAGLTRTEGRDYVIRDGDLVEFLFSG